MIGNTSLFDKHKNNLLLFFVFILISNNVYSDNMIIDDIENSNSSAEQKDYCENTVTKWCFVTDKVMGGVSEGSLKLIKEDNTAYYNMQGDISTANNGGFIQFRTMIQNHPKDKLFKGIRIKVRGNNEEYAIHLRTKYLFLPWQYYESKFMANNEWKIIELPFSSFIKSNFYQPSSVSSIDVQSIGIVAIGRNFKANIDLASIELY